MSRALKLAASLATTLLVSTSIPAHAADPLVIWGVVHDQCALNQQQHGDPKPCASVDLAGGSAVLKDASPKKPNQFLLIPTIRVTGIESPDLLKPGAPNYFAAAWKARTNLDGLVHKTLPRDDVALVINSVAGRTQEQLHIHIDCIQTEARDALRRERDKIGVSWTVLGSELSGRHYRVRRIDGAELGAANPFELLADGIEGAKADMGGHALILTGATFTDGKPGFYLLEDHTDLAAGQRARGEDLIDTSCAVAKE